ncbi:MAG: CRTAC1 family protein, partial [Elusimicrobia bacterium]|nr:CRTAC1 family protein [Elusimicrobiota bacterium]
APAAAPLFEDVTSTANFLGPSTDALDVLTIGAACFDYDHDGLPDLFLGGGRSLGGELWHNLGGMRFERVPGFVDPPIGERAVPVDYDGDGWTDLLVLGDPRSYTRLLRNREGKGFEDVTEKVGLDAPLGLTETALWFDADGDGRLDLYLVYLGTFVDRTMPSGDASNGSPNVLYLNKGGRFVDATKGSGLEDTHWGWGAAALDYDGDGREDVFLCNIWGRSRLFHNDGGGHFTDVTSSSGIDVPTLCKGVSVADVNGDGRPDLFINALSRPQEVWQSWAGGTPRGLLDPSSFSGGHVPLSDPGHERLYVNQGDGRFKEEAEELGAAETGFGWDGQLADLDLDGRPDLFVVNGFYPDTLFCHDERKVVRLFDPAAGRFKDVSAGSGADFLGCSRASLVGDFDRDGCPDVLVTGLHGARLLHGRCPAGNRWLRLTLSQPGPNAAALGALVTVRAGGRSRVFDWGRQGGGKVVSGCGELLVGLGKASRADEVEVAWPDGTREAFGPFAADTDASLRRGAGRRP